MSSCCGPSAPLDQTQAVDDRYGAAALEQEACLCTPVAFNPKWLDVIPSEVVERDYGCGDPTRWVESGDTVLDLGSGSGKNAFICAQVVGADGAVIGVDRNADMLALSRGAAPVVAERIGYSNVRFVEGAIEALDASGPDGAPLIADASVDLVLSNCVLNLVNPSSVWACWPTFAGCCARVAGWPSATSFATVPFLSLFSRTLSFGVAALVVPGKSRLSSMISRLSVSRMLPMPTARSSPGKWWRALSFGPSPSWAPSPAASRRRRLPLLHPPAAEQTHQSLLFRSANRAPLARA